MKACDFTIVSIVNKIKDKIYCEFYKYYILKLVTAVIILSITLVMILCVWHLQDFSPTFLEFKVQIFHREVPDDKAEFKIKCEA